MKLSLKSPSLAVGLAMFSMFFGAGNVIFPLLLGDLAGNKSLYALSGMLITAIIVPFMGLMSMVLFDSDTKAFFGRIGRIPGYFIALVILALIGPFGGIPRCVALSYSTMQLSMPGVPLWLFGIFACAVIFLLSVKKAKIVTILGYVLTPLLLLSLGVIIVSGFVGHPPAAVSAYSAKEAFSLGFREGYNTLDLLAAFFFSTVVLGAIQSRFPKKEGEETGAHRKRVMGAMFRASLIGAGLLGAIYGGLGMIASFYGGELAHIEPDQLLGALAFHLLGGHAGLLSNIAVALACLTTAITLAAIFSTLLSQEILRGKISYKMALAATMAVTYAISYLKVTGIVKLIAPIVVVCYPALIALALLNLWYKLKNFQPVRIPIAAVFALTLIYTVVGN